MNFLLRLFLTFSSVSFFLIVYLVQNKITFLSNIPNKHTWIVYLLYLLIPFILTFISLGLCMLLAKSTLNKVQSIETSNNDFLANYLAFFFVALSVNDPMTFWVVFGMTVVFTFFSRVSYFNPIFLVYGFNFYYVHTNENVKVMLISRKKLRNPDSVKPTEVRRINDYTFIDI
jgi:hypothetical protein